MASRAGSRWAATALCAPLLIWSGCAVEKPQLRLRDVAVAGLDFQELRVVFDFDVTNPNPFQLSLWGMEYGLSAAGERFAGGALTQPVAALRAKETITVRAPVSIQYRKLLPIVRRLGARKPIDYELSGTATFSFLGTRIPVPLKHLGKIPALRAPSWHFRDVRLAEGSAGVVELVFDVDNPNAFALPLASLRGTVRCGREVLVEVDRGMLTTVPPGRTARLVLPVRVSAAAAARALAQALTRRESVRFEGELKLGTPLSLRKMLLAGQSPDE